MSIYSVIREWSDKPFSYGVDCCQFVGAVVEDATGRNPMDTIDYDDEEQARAVIAGYGSLGAAMRARLGDTIPVDQARDTDVLLIDLRRHMPELADRIGLDEMAAVCWKGRAVVRTFAGVTDWPLSRASAAWRT